MNNRIVKWFATCMVALLTGVPAAAADNYSATWWNPQQNGMGISLIHQNQTVFAQWYAYDVQRRPTFIVFGGPLTSDAQGRDMYSGVLYIAHGTQPMHFDPSLTTTEVIGTMSITFTDRYHATMTYQYRDPSDGSTQSGTLVLTPLQFGCSASTPWNGTFCVAPMGTKVMGANQLPPGCTTWKDPCWKKAIADGTVKLVDTGAKLTGTSQSNRHLAIAYFRNTTSAFGVNGMWNTLVIYMDDGSPIGGDISDGVSQEIDWIDGVSDGIIRHIKDTGTCSKGFWSQANNIIDYGPVACPLL